ncbi:MAG: hypothetical protein M3N95_10535 [Actinomycetota bacterium]|nr:hypothetical protein [Actinomycetota bacterium]
MRSILWFDEIGLADVNLVGGKGASLGELISAALPSPYHLRLGEPRCRR